jgi:hypothetical protein
MVALPLLVTVLAAVASAEAAPNIGRPILEPAAITGGVRTPVRVQVEIVAPSLKLKSAKLLEVDEFGNVLRRLGQFKDNGKKGDHYPRDNIFTRQVVFKRPANSRIRLRAAVSFRGLPDAVLSDVVILEVTEPGLPNQPAPSDVNRIVEDPATGTRMISNEIVVFFTEGLDLAAIQGVIATVGGTLIGRLPEIGAWQVQIPGDGAASGVLDVVGQLKSFPEVLDAHPNAIFDTQVHENSVPPQLGLEQAHTVSLGSGVRIAIVDSGVDLQHPELVGRVTARVDQFFDDRDVSGHGTKVAGVAGVAAPGSDLLAIRAAVGGIRCVEGFYSTVSVAEGILRAVAGGGRIINVSLGYRDHLESLFRAVGFAVGANRVVIAAAGNERLRFPMFPARYDEVLAVGAVNEADRPWSDSHFGPKVEIWAPGVNIMSTYPRECGSFPYLDPYSGTSFATPFASGVAALVWSANPDLSQQGVRNVLIRSAEVLRDARGELVRDGAYNVVCRLDAAYAVRLASRCGRRDCLDAGRDEALRFISEASYCFGSYPGLMPLSSLGPVSKRTALASLGFVLGLVVLQIIGTGQRKKLR